MGLSMRVLGFMTGTSLDAVDMAVIETDGENILAFGPAAERKLSPETRAICLEATMAALSWTRGDPPPAIFEAASAAVAREHLKAASSFLAAEGMRWPDLDLVGMHGQTVLHQRGRDGACGRTVQLGDADWLAAETGVPVVYDFRSADVAAGGEGAPLAPLYHLARAKASGLKPPLAVLNLGGIANVTLWTGGDELFAFDTGPANGMLDLLVQARTSQRFDVDGRLAAQGHVDEEILRAYLADPYFLRPPPKSLDRYDFPLAVLDALSLPDAAATLLAFTVQSIGLGLQQMQAAPAAIVVCGGGRLNPTLMRALRKRLGSSVHTAEDMGWRGDFVEAEAFAYLAARSKLGLPLSLPGTTGVARPLTGGRIAYRHSA
jgi:anhydro-N-acetylmuramic acid kinase